MNVEKVGAYLASLRRGRGMTQQQVADILGVSNKTISKWESGAGLPDIAALPSLAALYGVTADDILAGETRPRTCGDASSEVGEYLERRSDQRFRICCALAVLAVMAGWLFSGVWSYLTLTAAVLAVWIGWGRSPGGDTLRRRLLMLVPLGAAWVYVLARDVPSWNGVSRWVSAVLPNAQQAGWAQVMIERFAVWLLLLVTLGLLYGVGSLIVRQPLLKDKATRRAAFIGWGLTLCSEAVCLLLCWQPALAYITTATYTWSSTRGDYTSLAGERVMAFYNVYDPVMQVQRGIIAVTVIVCIVLALRARRREKGN